MQALSAGTMHLSAMPSNQVVRVDSRTGITYDVGTLRTSAWVSQGRSSVSFNQTTASEQPLYQATGFGASMPGVLFDGSDDKLWNTFSAMSTQNYTIAVGFRYTAGAGNYHQGSIGGSASSATEGGSDDYFSGMGMRPVAPHSIADGFTVYNGPPPSGVLYNQAHYIVAGAKSTTQALGAAWEYSGGANSVRASVAGVTKTPTLDIKTTDIDETLESISVGMYTYGCLEGQMGEAHLWDRPMRQEELNRATRVIRGRQQ